MMLMSFILIFMAEMADKTQLLVLALSRRYSLRSVISGMTLSIVLLSLLSIWAGSWLNACIPIDAIRPAAAVLFLLFGFSALKPKPEEVKEGRRFHADWLSVAARLFHRGAGRQDPDQRPHLAASTTRMPRSSWAAASACSPPTCWRSPPDAS